MAWPIFRHAGLKALSVLLGTLVWLLVSGEQLVERVMSVPLELANLSSDLEVVGDTVDTIDVRIRGSSGALSRLSAGDLVTVLDLSNARQGQRLVNVSSADVRVPFGIEVVQVSPSSLSMRFERSVSKTVPIRPSIEGEPAEGFLVGTATSDPESVEVVGAESALNAVTEAMTEPVSVAGASVPVSETVNVGVTGRAIRLRQPLRALVTVDIVPMPVEWTVEAVPVQIGNGDREMAVSPAAVTVQVRGPARAGTAGVLRASVDVAGLAPGEHDLAVVVDTPPGVGVMWVDPPRVRVTVR